MNLNNHELECIRFYMGDPEMVKKYLGGPKAYNTINAVTTSNDLGVTVGFFEDDLMMISNSDYTAHVTVTIDTESQLLMLDDDGNWQSLDSDSVEIAAGDGRLFKIII